MDARHFPRGQGETLRRMAAAVNYNRWLVDRSRPYLHGSVLDAGAGVGTFTEVAASIARKVVALEPNPAFVPALEQRLSDRPNVEVLSATIEDSGLSSAFDAVVCFNVLEHIREDGAALAAFHDALVPGGHLLLLVPAHPLLFGETDRTVGHERRYRKSGLARLIDASKYEVVDLRYVNPIGAIGWLVSSRVLRQEQIPAAPLRAFDRFVPLLRRLDNITLPFGLSLWSVARKA